MAFKNDVPPEVQETVDRALGKPKEPSRVERRDRLLRELRCSECKGRSSVCVHCGGTGLSPNKLLNKLVDIEIALEGAHAGPPLY